MSRKTTIDALFAKRKPDPLGAPNTGGEAAAPVVRSGAVAAMGASLQQWSAAQKTAEDLQAQLADAVTVLELDPAAIDPAPVRDRLDLETDPSFDALIRSIEASGQQVPILVRPHPVLTGRYQAAYGHRRMAAAKRLGAKVRAVVSALSDEALVVAQGKENSERRDLSFIEKALFARRLEDAGFSRGMISDALGTDKADLSRSLAVARAVPEAVILAVGAAPKAGRARWLALSERLKNPDYLAGVEALVVTHSFRALSTDQRFAATLDLVLPSANGSTGTASLAPERILHDGTGREIGKIRQVGTTTRLSLNDALTPGFSAYLGEHLPEIFQTYQASLHRKGRD